MPKYRSIEHPQVGSTSSHQVSVQGGHWLSSYKAALDEALAGSGKAQPLPWKPKHHCVTGHLAYSAGNRPACSHIKCFMKIYWAQKKERKSKWPGCSGPAQHQQRNGIDMKRWQREEVEKARRTARCQPWFCWWAVCTRRLACLVWAGTRLAQPPLHHAANCLLSPWASRLASAVTKPEHPPPSSSQLVVLNNKLPWWPHRPPLFSFSTFYFSFLFLFILEVK